jgi:DNA-binding NarL/FixJ family response regulator
MAPIQVLLIEDHEVFRLGMRTTLSQSDDFVLVGEATTGKDGLQLLTELKPDVAVVDIGLPDFDGVKLTHRFKQSIQSTESVTTKILILTMYDFEATVLAACAAGADSYCMKNLSFMNLADVIRLTHQGHCWIDPEIARILLNQVQPVANPEMMSYLPEAASHNLTDREYEILQLIVDGCSNSDIAERLFLTVGTIKSHIRNVMNKLSVNDRTQMAVFALRCGLVR